MKNGVMKTIYEIGEAPCKACGIGDMRDELDDAPTVDAVEVVRCKDCKKWETINCPFARDFVKWDGFKFCAWGERKEDELLVTDKD